MAFEKNSIEWAMFAEFRKICQRYGNIKYDADEWLLMVEAGINFTEKYRTKFALDLMKAYTEEMTRRCLEADFKK